MDIDQLNIESGVFLRRLRTFSEKNHIQVNEQTAELFMDIVQFIDKIIANAEIISAKDNDSLRFLFELNEQQFDLRQYIMCRLCIEQIGITKNELEAHLRRNANVHTVREATESAPITVQMKNENPKSITSEESAVGSKHSQAATVFNAKVPNVISRFINGCHSTSNVNKSDSGNGSISSNEFSPTANQIDASKYNSSHLIHVRSLPWIATKGEIVDFFGDIKILNGTNGIHFIIDESKNSHNDAFIQLATYNDYQMAMKRKIKSMGSALVRTSEANVHDFMKLVNKSTYPKEQRVLRLEGLPSKCTVQDIFTYFAGRSVSKVHLVVNDANQFAGKAFVLFASIDEIEMALANMDRKKIHNVYVKVFRSSEEQFRNYCDAETAIKSSMFMKNGRMNSVPNLTTMNRKINGSKPRLNETDGWHEILARGFPWNVTAADVGIFFNNIQIIGGIQGIRIRKNVAMEATFFVHTNTDLQNALARDKARFNDKLIHVSKLNSDLNSHLSASLMTLML